MIIYRNRLTTATLLANISSFQQVVESTVCYSGRLTMRDTTITPAELIFDAMCEVIADTHGVK